MRQISQAISLTFLAPSVIQSLGTEEPAIPCLPGETDAHDSRVNLVVEDGANGRSRTGRSDTVWVFPCQKVSPSPPWVSCS